MSETIAAKPAAVAVAAPPKKERKTAAKSLRYPFWFGGSASSMAACVTHPLDLIKVRLQLRSGNAPTTMAGTFMHILKNAGPIGLYNGLSASILRQMTYSTVRFGVYEEMKNRIVPRDQKPGLGLLVLLSATSGVLGGISGNAADVVNVRMQQDAALPAAQRRHYKHGLDGMFRMLREEGVKSWFRGVGPNSARAALMNVGQLASYDTFKGLLLRHTPLGDTITTHFTASFMAGFVATTICSPFDVVKSRVMNAHGNHGMVTLVKDIFAKEGVTWMFKGWVPAFLRLAPQTICTFLFLEAHRKAYRQWKGIPE